MVLCDDQELVRAGFRLILDLEDSIEVVGEAVDGQECLRLAAERDRIQAVVLGYESGYLQPGQVRN